MAAKDTKTAYAFCSDCVKQVTFIRHGEAEHNVAVRETGSNAAYSDPRWEDAALTEDGLQQAMQLQADLLKTGTKFDIVLVSPLMRTLQTAIATFATEPDSQNSLSALATPDGTAKSLPFLAVELIREAFGEHCCDKRSPLSAIQGDFPEVDFSLVETDADTWHDAEKRESLRQVAARGQKFIDFLAALPQRNIAVVSHGVFLETLFGHVLQCGDPRATAKRFMNCECRTLTLALPPPDATPPPQGQAPQHSTPLPDSFIVAPAVQTVDATGASTGKA